MTNISNIKNLEMTRKIATEVSQLGGSTYFVGGCVRDKFLAAQAQAAKIKAAAASENIAENAAAQGQAASTDENAAQTTAAAKAQAAAAAQGQSDAADENAAANESKDIDIEVHGIEKEQLSAILDKLGEKITIGQSFGVFALKGYTIDIAMPRIEEQTGRGHRDFDVKVSPSCGTRIAAIRRDFTINSMMENVLTGKIIDHFGGKKDLEQGIIRHVNSETFVEDPLRVLRAAQFAARFGFSICHETVELCQKMDLTSLPKERIIVELKKAMLKSEKPSIFFQSLRKMNQLSYWFPELEALISIPQSQAHHKEGDTWTHTMMVLDAAASLKKYSNNPFGFMLAALTHDFGKAICTEFKNGDYHAYNHETLGLPIIKRFLERLTHEKTLKKYVLNLAEYHMKPGVVASANSSIKSTNKMFDLSQDPEGLLAISIADGLGKLPKIDAKKNEAFFKDRLDIYRQYLSRPYVTGKDLINAGLVPDKNFGKHLSLAHKLRLSGIDKDSALKQILGSARR